MIQLTPPLPLHHSSSTRCRDDVLVIINSKQQTQLTYQFSGNYPGG